jgi:hypothetical protein
LVLSHEGLGPLLLGADPWTLPPAAAIVQLKGVDCGDGVVHSFWSPIYPERPLDNEIGAFEVGVIEQGNRVQIIQVFDRSVRTPEGVHIGDTFAAFQQAYPSAELVATRLGRDQYLIAGEPGNVYVQVTSNAESPDQWTAAEVDRVYGLELRDSTLEAPSPSYVPISAVCL